MAKALVILCGGLSTRMGSDKAFLPFGRTPLLNYQTERFRPYFDKIYLSVPASAERPIDYTARCGCPVIEDTASRLGPIGGLYSCLQKAPEDVLFFHSVDAPFTDPALAAAITDAAAADPQTYATTITDPQGSIQPTFAAYTKDCLPYIEQMIRQDTYKLRVLYDSLGRDVHYRIYAHFHTPGQFFNMNDPQSYYFALQQLARRTPSAFPPDFAAGSVANDTQADPCAPVLSFTAKSGTGKTTYLERLLPLLKEQGLRIAVVKHDAHGFEIDKPGKDSYRLSHAGADHMILTSTDQTAAVIRHPGQSQDFDSVLARIKNVDLILSEGYKHGRQKKIHLLRKGHNETPVGNPANTIAFITDFPYAADVPVFDLNRPGDLIPFLMEYVRTEQARRQPDPAG